MENVLNAFKIINKKIDSYLKCKYEDGIEDTIEDYYEISDKYLCNIQNKLLSLTTKETRVYYSRIISRTINDEYIMFLDWFESSPEDSKPCEAIEIAINIFIARIIALFQDCDIELIDYLNKQDNISKVNYTELKRFSTQTNSNVYNIHSSIRKTNPAKAVLSQQWVIIRNLMECATDWRLTNDENKLMYNKTDIAKFLSFLCGGSEDRIRKQLEEELPAKEINEIIPYLENIGLYKIADRIKKDTK